MSSRLKLTLVSAVFLALLVAGGIYLRKLSVRPERTLPRLGAFPDFELPDASGKIWRKADLRGSIWIVSSFPPGCVDCATLGFRLADLQTSLEKARGVILVTFVSDPRLQNPGSLADLARQFGAQPDRWVFLSGSVAIPSARVVVIDRDSEIRGVDDPARLDFSSEVLDGVGDLLRETGSRR